MTTATKEKTSLDLIQKFLARSNLSLTLSPDNRIIGVNVRDRHKPLLEREIEGIFDILKTTLKFYQGWQWFVAGLILSGLEISEDFAQVLPPDETLKKWCMVYERYAVSERCFALSFSHYQEVCFMKDKAARANLLKQAVEKGWTKDELRLARNLDEGKPSPKIDFEFTITESFMTPLHLWQKGITIDKVMYDDLLAKYGRDEMVVKLVVVGRK